MALASRHWEWPTRNRLDVYSPIIIIKKGLGLDESSEKAGDGRNWGAFKVPPSLALQ